MAGLLDNLLFNPSSYGGQGGGLLDFLRTTQMQNNNYQPSAGFAPIGQQPPVPQDTSPPAAASPLSIGGYQMPRIGDASQFDPSQVNIPQNAQPTQGQPTPMDTTAQMPGLQPAAATQPGLTTPSLFSGLGSMARPDSIVGRLFGNSSSNLTARALIAKGVDPQTVQAATANPELMKLLITQHYGPHNVQSLGNGYVYDPQTGKTTRAYEPEDKTPIGFQKTDNGLEPIPGGPADPAYLRLKAAQSSDPNAVHVLGKGGELYKVDEKGNPTVVHKNEDNTQASLDDATAAMMAKQYLAGDRSVLTNLGRGAQGSANIVKLRSAIKAEADAEGLNGADIAQRMIDYVGDTSRERTAGTQEGRMGPAGIEAMGAVKLARQASLAVPRGNWVPINIAIQAAQRNSGDPNIRAFGAANTTLINTYARAINPNGIGTVADKEHAREMLSTADSPAAYEAVLSQLEREVQMAHASPAQARGQFKIDRERRLNGLPPVAPAFSQPSAPASRPKPPNPGDVQGGYRFKGGDPADKSNWILEQRT